jgi:type IV secretory pathway protease TraF
MLPALSPGEYVLFDRLAYRREAPRRGDVVLARQPGTGLLVVKRVAGAPGESVSQDGREWSLAEDEYLLLGDDPEVSRDSRDWGPVGRRAILARAWLVYWPPARMRRVGV